MKICIFTETYYPVVGGGETQAKLLADGLAANGHSVIILTRRTDTSLKQHERYDGIDVYRLSPTGKGQLKKWGLLLSSLPALIRLRGQYDLIFVSGFRIIGLSAVLIARLLGKRTILKSDSQGEMSGEFFEHGLKSFGISSTNLFFRLFLGFRNAVLKRADAFSAISPEIVDEFRTGGIPEQQIHLIPNGVDTTYFVPVDPSQKISLRQKLNLPAAAVIAIYTGRLVSYKGLPLLLEVWNEIRSRHSNVLLILAGTGGLDIHNCEDQLHSYVASAGLDKFVLFTGAIRNVNEYLQASNIFAFPTENDAFPSSLVEAMACALPVVATPVGAIPSIVKDRENGLIIEEKNFIQLYHAIDSLISNPELATRLGAAALKSVHLHYSAKIVTNNYLSLFQNALTLAAK